MNEIKNEYKCVTDPVEVKAYLGDSKIVSFDYETAPDDGYRDEDKAALDAAKSHICTTSLSVKEHTGIMIPVAHKVGPNMPKAEFDALLTEFLTDRSIIKVAHNLSFESMFSYAKGIVIMPPVYDTIAASQMTLKNAYDFRKLSDSGLKKLAGKLCGEPLPSFFSVTDGKHFDELDSMDAGPSAIAVPTRILPFVFITSSTTGLTVSCRNIDFWWKRWKVLQPYISAS